VAVETAAPRVDPQLFDPAQLVLAALFKTFRWLRHEGKALVEVGEYAMLSIDR
jgi:hypothetical protein